MVVGDDLGYTELYTELQKAEHALRRQVNPTFLSVQDWQRRLAQKNSFVSKISTQPKTFVLGSEYDLRP